MFPELALIFATSLLSSIFEGRGDVNVNHAKVLPLPVARVRPAGEDVSRPHLALFSERQKAGGKLFILIGEDRSKKNYLPTVSEPIKLKNR